MKFTILLLAPHGTGLSYLLPKSIARLLTFALVGVRQQLGSSNLPSKPMTPLANYAGKDMLKKNYMNNLVQHFGPYLKRSFNIIADKKGKTRVLESELASKSRSEINRQCKERI